MRFTIANRKLFLIVALVGTILLAIIAPQNQDAIELTRNIVHGINKTDGLSVQSTKAEKTEQNNLLPIKRSSTIQSLGDLFLVSRIKQQKALAIETPVAPPLPFSYMGKIIENGKLTIFLTRDDKTYAISAGETIDHQYMVNAITSQRIDFTYIPLGQKQTMMTGAN